MTLEERIKLLKGYNSFYELEIASEFANYRKLIEFIKKNNRRPKTIV